MARVKEIAAAQSSTAIGFKTEFWLAVAKLRKNMDAAKYKRFVASELAPTA